MQFFDSLKTYMRKAGLRDAQRPSLLKKKKAMSVIQQRSATLHYNCLPRSPNAGASWILPDCMAEGGCSGNPVLGWEMNRTGNQQVRAPANNYPVSCSVRLGGLDQWCYFRLDQPESNKEDFSVVAPHILAASKKNNSCR